MTRHATLAASVFVWVYIASGVSGSGDCQVSPWGQWGECIGNCIFSMRVRNRIVLRPPFPKIGDVKGVLIMEPCPPLYQIQQCVPTRCLESNGKFAVNPDFAKQQEERSRPIDGRSSEPADEILTLVKSRLQNGTLDMKAILEKTEGIMAVPAHKMFSNNDTLEAKSQFRPMAVQASEQQMQQLFKQLLAIQTVHVTSTAPKNKNVTESPAEYEEEIVEYETEEASTTLVGGSKAQGGSPTGSEPVASSSGSSTTQKPKWRPKWNFVTGPDFIPVPSSSSSSSSTTSTSSTTTSTSPTPTTLTTTPRPHPTKRTRSSTSSSTSTTSTTVPVTTTTNSSEYIYEYVYEDYIIDENTTIIWLNATLPPGAPIRFALPQNIGGSPRSSSVPSPSLSISASTSASSSSTTASSGFSSTSSSSTSSSSNSSPPPSPKPPSPDQSASGALSEPDSHDITMPVPPVFTTRSSTSYFYEFPLSVSSSSPILGPRTSQRPDLPPFDLPSPPPGVTAVTGTDATFTFPFFETTTPSAPRASAPPSSTSSPPIPIPNAVAADPPGPPGSDPKPVPFSSAEHIDSPENFPPNAQVFKEIPVETSSTSTPTLPIIFIPFTSTVPAPVTRQVATGEPGSLYRLTPEERREYALRARIRFTSYPDIPRGESAGRFLPNDGSTSSLPIEEQENNVLPIIKSDKVYIEKGVTIDFRDFGQESSATGEPGSWLRWGHPTATPTPDRSGASIRTISQERARQLSENSRDSNSRILHQERLHANSELERLREAYLSRVTYESEAKFLDQFKNRQLNSGSDRVITPNRDRGDRRRVPTVSVPAPPTPPLFAALRIDDGPIGFTVDPQPATGEPPGRTRPRTPIRFNITMPSKGGKSRMQISPVIKPAIEEKSTDRRTVHQSSTTTTKTTTTTTATSISDDMDAFLDNVHKPCGDTYGNRRCCKLPPRPRAGTDRCVPYNYGYCGADLEQDEKPIKFQEECYEICYTDDEKRSMPIFRDLKFQNGVRIAAANG